MTEPTETTRRKVVRPDGYGITKHTTLEGDVWFDGCARTQHGFVRVYSEKAHTMLMLIIDGHEYCRRYGKGFSARGLVTLAARFAQEMQDGN